MISPAELVLAQIPRRTIRNILITFSRTARGNSVADQPMADRCKSHHQDRTPPQADRLRQNCCIPAPPQDGRDSIYSS